MRNSQWWGIPINARDSDVWKCFRVFCVFWWNYCYCVPFTTSSPNTPSHLENVKMSYKKQLCENSTLGAWKKRVRGPRWSPWKRMASSAHSKRNIRKKKKKQPARTLRAVSLTNPQRCLEQRRDFFILRDIKWHIPKSLESLRISWLEQSGCIWILLFN